jgi:UDP-N-acetylglucosamine transferase subunit ALG13
VSRRTVVVSTGTYHLPFDRLIDWIGTWDRPEDVDVVLQHGVGSPLAGCQNHVMIPPDQLAEIYRTADALVLQGGAGGIMDARAAGRIPIVVPRVPGTGEVVDDHQIAFSGELATMGVVHLCQSEAALHAALDDVLSQRLPTWTSPMPTPGVDASIGLLERPIPRLRARERGRRIWTMTRMLAAGRRAAAAPRDGHRHTA